MENQGDTAGMLVENKGDTAGMLVENKGDTAGMLVENKDDTAVEALENHGHIVFVPTENQDPEPLYKKCAHLALEVTETRKVFGKICNDYREKSALMETRWLEAKIKNSPLFFKHSFTCDPEIDDFIQDTENFEEEILERTAMLKKMRKKVKDSHDVVTQMKSNPIAWTSSVAMTSESFKKIVCMKNQK